MQLPGVQNSAEVKDLLGKVATLELRLVDTQDNPMQAEQGGHAPLGTKLYKREDGSPILLKREVIVTGDELTSATSTTSTRKARRCRSSSMPVAPIPCCVPRA